MMAEGSVFTILKRAKFRFVLFRSVIGFYAHFNLFHPASHRTIMSWQTVENQYFRDMKLFGQLAGVWPRQERFAKLCVRLFSFPVVAVSFLSMMSRVILFYSTDVLFEGIMYMDISISIFVKQYHYVLNAKKIDELLNEIVVDRLTKYPKEELAILDSYFNKASFIASSYRGILYLTALAYIFLPAVPPILNIIKPLNESRGRVFIVPGYYFVDEEKYYYPIITHMIIAIIILTIVYIACDIILIYFIHHGCSLLTISGYRFKHAFDGVSSCYGKDNNVLQKVNAKLYQAIEGHQRAVEFVSKINVCYMYYFLVLVGEVIVAFASTFVILSMIEVGSMFFVFCMFTVAQLFHLLFLMAMGQYAINVNEQVFQSIYEAKWYNGSPKSQMLYVLILRKCLDPSVLTCGGLVPLNLYSYVQVLKASFSYYTVFSS